MEFKLLPLEDSQAAQVAQASVRTSLLSCKLLLTCYSCAYWRFPRHPQLPGPNPTGWKLDVRNRGSTQTNFGMRACADL